MVKSTDIVRRIDELGRVVLPIEIRKALAIEERDGLEFLLDVENEQIILQKAARTCMKCKPPENQ